MAFVPATHGETGKKALTTLSEIAFKHSQAKRHLFPFVEVHTDNEEIAPVYKSLGLNSEVGIVAVNAKRGWWRHYEGEFSHASVESWIDAIRMNEGARNKLPEAIVGEVVAETGTSADDPIETIEVKMGEDIKVEIPSEESSTSWQGAEPTPEATDAPPKHEEL